MYKKPDDIENSGTDNEQSNHSSSSNAAGNGNGNGNERPRTADRHDYPTAGGGKSPVFIAGLFVPTIVDDETVPIPARKIGVVEGGTGDEAVMLPADADIGSPYWPGQYRLETNATLVWASNVREDAFGEAIVETDEFNWSYIIDNPTGSVEVDLHSLFDIKEDVPTPSLLRPRGLTLQVSFREDSAFESHVPEGGLSATVPYVTPNQSTMYWERMVEVSSKVYDRGVDAADKVTRVDLGKVRRYARLLAYTQVAHIDLLTEGDLLRDAAFEGMSAFEEPLRESRDLTNLVNRSISTTMAGPVVGYHRPPDGDEFSP